MSSPLERLPAELFHRIASLVMSAGSPLAPLATASRQCQVHVEALTFGYLRINPTELHEFERIVNRERFLALHILSFRVATAGWEYTSSGTNSCCIDSDVLSARNKALTKSIRDFLTILKEKSELLSGQPHLGIDLSLEIPSFSQYNCYLDLSSEDINRPRLLQRAWATLHASELPSHLIIPGVFSLYVGGIHGTSWGLWPASWTALSAHFPQLTSLDLQMYDLERKCLESRRRARDEFGLSLQRLPNALQEFDLEYCGESQGNEFLAPHDLRSPNTGYDIFSCELGNLCHRLVKLELSRATLDLVHFFRTCAQDTCPFLTTLTITLSSACADGSWYFVYDSRHGCELPEEELEDIRTFDEMREYMAEEDLPATVDHPLNPFRTAFDVGKFKEVYTTAAAAAKMMPRLRDLRITFDIAGQGDFGGGQHDFLCARGGSEFLSRGSSTDIRVAWTMDPELDIDLEVIDAWVDVGKTMGTSIQILQGDSTTSYLSLKGYRTLF